MLGEAEKGLVNEAVSPQPLCPGRKEQLLPLLSVLPHHMILPELGLRTLGIVWLRGGRCPGCEEHRGRCWMDLQLETEADLRKKGSHL